MPVKIIHPDHVEIIGLTHVLLTAPHTASPDADLHTGQIVEEAALTSRSFAVIGKVSGEFSDLNRIQSAQSELRKGIEGFIAEDGIRYVLEICGKKESGVVLGTSLAQTCTDSTTELVKSRLVEDFTVTANTVREKEPTSIVAALSRKAPEGQFVIETIQLQFGNEERQFQREKVIRDISEIADILNAR